MVRAAPQPGAHIRRRGEVVSRARRCFPRERCSPRAPSRLSPPTATAELPVLAAPRVAILTTGDEVVAPERRPRPVSSATPTPTSCSRPAPATGARPHPLGIAPDRADVLRDDSREGLGTTSSSCPAASRWASSTWSSRCSPARRRAALRRARDPTRQADGRGGPSAADSCSRCPATRRPRWSASGSWSAPRCDGCSARRRVLARGAGRTAHAPLPAARDRDRILPARVRFDRSSAGRAAGSGGIARPRGVRAGHRAGARARGVARARRRGAVRDPSARELGERADAARPRPLRSAGGSSDQRNTPSAPC